MQPNIPIVTSPASSLWFDALQTLSEQDQKLLGEIKPIQGFLSNEIDDLIIKTKKKQTECKENSYKFNFLGREIFLEDVAEKIVFWLNKVKDLGDVAASFDPVHAGIPWAVIKFCLQVLLPSLGSRMKAC